MKKIILIFAIFFTSLVAKDIDTTASIKIYKTDDLSLNIDNIKKYSSEFVELNDEVFDDKDVSYWLEIKLDKNMKDDVYIGYFIGFDIVQSSLLIKEFYVGDLKHFKFLYKDLKSDTIYFQIEPNVLSRDRIFLKIMSEDNYFGHINDAKMMQFLIGLVLGTIFMAIVYNLGIFYFTKERVFLYYSLMQIFIILLNLFASSVMFLSLGHKLLNLGKFELIDLFATLFFILFSREFFDTSKFTPKLDKILLFYLAVVGIDIVITLFYRSVILIDMPYSLFLSLLILVGFVRLYQGFKPAYFFLGGWIVMLISIAMIEFFGDDLFFNPMLIGSAVEAIMLSFAISYKFKLLHDENEQHRYMIVQQSKLASLGELLGNIAHQWRQPLTRLSYIFMNIEEIDDKKERSKKVKEGVKQLEFMSQTIDDFRDFYAPNVEKELFSIAKETQNTIDIMCDTFSNLNITCKLIVKKDKTIKNYKNQYRQALINLLSNAKDALIETKIKKPIIKIVVDGDSIMVEDNAKGIDQDIVHKIFEPYFTTKDKHDGIGLYMSKIIVEKNLNGTLSVQNSSLGAVFTIVLKG